MVIDELKKINVVCPLCKRNYRKVAFMVKTDKEKIVWCGNWRKHAEIIRKRIYDKIPQEKKQIFLDNFWNGLNVGESYKKAGLTQEEGFAVMDSNIEKTSYLRSEAK